MSQPRQIFATIVASFARITVSGTTRICVCGHMYRASKAFLHSAVRPDPRIDLLALFPIVIIMVYVTVWKKLYCIEAKGR